MLPILHAALSQSDSVTSGPTRTDLSVNRNTQLDRFRLIYSNRQEWRRETRAVREYYAGTHRGHRTTKRSSNCRTKQLALDRIDQMKARAKRKQLEADIDALEQAMIHLERERCLSESARLMCRTNRACGAVDLAREYFKQFASGYDASDLDRVQQSAMTRQYMESVMLSDVMCREYKGVDNFLNQWQCYTENHERIEVHLRQITLIDDDEKWISVRGVGVTHLTISPQTFEKLFPSFYERTQQDPTAKALAQALVGKEYCVDFDLVFHFNSLGRVVAHESKVHLATALLALLQDPIAAMDILDASLMTEDGHWKMAEDGPVQESMYSLPKKIL